MFVEGDGASPRATPSTKIAKGKLKPVAWSPASSLWGRLLNFEADSGCVAAGQPVDRAHAARDRDVGAAGAGARLAEASTLGFEQILALALDTQGWATYGQPEFGPFKLGHTNPDFSTSGLSRGRRRVLRGDRQARGPDRRRRRRARRCASEVKDIERSIVHYGDTTLFFADQLEAHGPGLRVARWRWRRPRSSTSTRAARGHRSSSRSTRRRARSTPTTRYIVLDAPWVTPAQKRGRAGVFGDVPRRADHAARSPRSTASARATRRRSRWRRSTPRTAPTRPQPKRVLSACPSRAVLAAIKRAVARGPQARQHRARARHVGLDERRGQARAGQARAAACSCASSRRSDRVGLDRASTTRSQRRPCRSPFTPEPARRLQSAINGLFPDGGTAVYDATEPGVDGAPEAARPTPHQRRRRAHRRRGQPEPARPPASSSPSCSARRGRRRRPCACSRSPTAPQANRDELGGIAEASGGKDYEGDPDDIESVYRSISLVLLMAGKADHPLRRSQRVAAGQRRDQAGQRARACAPSVVAAGSRSARCGCRPSRRRLRRAGAR